MAFSKRRSRVETFLTFETRSSDAGRSTGADSFDHRLIAAAVLTTVSSVFPGFLAGALAVQVSEEFSVSEKIYGWALGGFFLAATVGSLLLGRLAQTIGPRRQIMMSLSASVGAQLAVAWLVSGFVGLVVALAVCGMANAATQTAVNLALTQARIERLGLAIALKQSGMPTASLLGGLMVPALALTVGWRWAFMVGVAMAIAALAAVSAVVPRSAAVPLSSRPRPVSTPSDLAVAALAGGFLSFGAGSLNAWIVSSGVDAGLGEGQAGLMLSLGAGCGIALRLFSGFRLDGLQMRPFRVAGTTVLIGALGAAGLAVRSVPVHVLATVVAFAGGWVWPVFTNFGIVRTNSAAAGSATGTTQMGVYIGVFSAPLVTGWLIEVAGYPAMWLLVALSIVTGAVLALAVAHRF